MCCSFGSRTEIAMISRQSVSVRDPNEQHIIDSFEISHRHHDGALNMLAWANSASFGIAVQNWFANPVLSDDMCYSAARGAVVRRAEGLAVRGGPGAAAGASPRAGRSEAGGGRRAAARHCVPGQAWVGALAAFRAPAYCLSAPPKACN